MTDQSNDILGWFPQQLWIDGQWRPAESGATFAVENPATGKTIAEVPRAGKADALAAVKAAIRAKHQWAHETPQKRAEYLLRIAQLLIEHREQLANVTTLELGETLQSSRGGVDYAVGFFRWYAEEIRRLYGRTIPHPDPTRRLRVEYFPVGVVGAITPWNGPLGSGAKKVAGALAAGCPVVHKPAQLTPLSALAMARITEMAGLPAGVFNVVCGDTQAIGRVLLDEPEVRLITFTGSSDVGRYLMAEGGRQVKRLSLELGGNAPFIVFADADLDRAADDLVWLKTLNCGQVCVTANRIFIERSILEPFLERVIVRLKRHRLGVGTDPQTTIGPLVDRHAREKVKVFVDGAIAAGARVRYRGEVPESCRDGYFYPLTLLDNITPDMPLVCEEVFGPVLSVMTFESEAEVLRIANDTPYGLAAYAYTTDMARAQRCSEELDAGVVGINDPRPITPEAPFGGVKQSGLGHEGGIEGLREFLETRLIGVRCHAQNVS
jgi:succinate-semialdehyde dehydrogenase / glutarate-semialdehyde dehydrogenase